jgi:hypothetical protein
VVAVVGAAAAWAHAAAKSDCRSNDGLNADPLNAVFEYKV